MGDDQESVGPVKAITERLKAVEARVDKLETALRWIDESRKQARIDCIAPVDKAIDEALDVVGRKLEWYADSTGRFEDYREDPDAR